MSLSESAYQIDKNMEKRLKFWLNMDAWEIDDAVQILIGIDPEKTVKPHTHTNYGRLPGSISLFNGCQIPEPPPEKEYRLVGGELFDSLELVEDNRKRQHSTLGYKSPIQFLDAWLIAQQKEKLVA